MDRFVIWMGQELGCDELPEGLCRPSMERIAPGFRKACDRFPVLAESIVKTNGLGTAEFNRYDRSDVSVVLQ